MLYRQRSSFFYEMRIKPAEKTISPFRKRTSEPGRTQKTKYAAVSRIPSEAAVGRRVQGSVKRNVFVKPNEQSRACASYAMARKRRKKFKAFSAVSPPLTDCRSERLSGLPLLSFTDRQNTPAYQLTTAAIYNFILRRISEPLHPTDSRNLRRRAVFADWPRPGGSFEQAPLR